MSSLATATSQGSGAGSLLIFALPVLLIIFMVMQQRRRQRATQSVQSSLQVGDEVSTTSGLLGRVAALDDAVVSLEVSPGVIVRFNRRAIAGPVSAAALSGAPAAPDQDAAERSAAADTAAEDAPGTGVDSGETTVRPTPPAE